MVLSAGPEFERKPPETRKRHVRRCHGCARYVTPESYGNAIVSDIRAPVSAPAALIGLALLAVTASGFGAALYTDRLERRVAETFRDGDYWRCAYPE